MTTTADQGKLPDYVKEDVPLVAQWRAHKDSINYISWTPELKVVSSCSFDCNVYMWGDQDGKMVRKGSLVLGNRA